MADLRPVDTDIWTAETTFRSYGLKLATRMTVVRLGDGGLWLHAPAQPDDALVRAIAALGTVSEIVAPNCFHYLFADAWREIFPASHLHAAPALARRRHRLPVDAALTTKPASAWEGEIDQVLIDGMPRLHETVFFHRTSRTAIFTDLLSNVGPEAPLSQRLWMVLNGAYGHPATTRFVRAQLRSRSAARAAVERVLGWDFQRALCAHGRILEDNAKAAVRRGLGWLLD